MRCAAQPRDLEAGSRALRPPAPADCPTAGCESTTTTRGQSKAGPELLLKLFLLFPISVLSVTYAPASLHYPSLHVGMFWQVCGLMSNDLLSDFLWDNSWKLGAKVEERCVDHTVFIHCSLKHSARVEEAAAPCLKTRNPYLTFPTCACTSAQIEAKEPAQILIPHFLSQTLSVKEICTHVHIHMWTNNCIFLECDAFLFLLDVWAKEKERGIGVMIHPFRADFAVVVKNRDLRGLPERCARHCACRSESVPCAPSLTPLLSPACHRSGSAWRTGPRVPGPTGWHPTPNCKNNIKLNNMSQTANQEKINLNFSELK